MTDHLHLPENIKRFVSGKAYRSNEVGMSKAKILLFDDLVLKISGISSRSDDTVRVMRWLEGKLPVPKVVCCEQDAENQYLLMSRVPGKMSCDEKFLAHPAELIERLAEALQMLWSVDLAGCPRTRDIDTELKEARYRVENGLADPDSAGPDTFGEGGFQDPQELLSWLENNRPAYEPVFSHGDLCLPNLFIDGGRISGFIDLEAAGTGDKWRDVALCYRSLKWNAEGVYGGRVFPGVDPDRLFEALGIEPDREKIRYYMLLDELF